MKTELPKVEHSCGLADGLQRFAIGSVGHNIAGLHLCIAFLVTFPGHNKDCLSVVRLS